MSIEITQEDKDRFGADMARIVANCDHRWGGTSDIGGYVSVVCGKCGATRTTKTETKCRFPGCHCIGTDKWFVDLDDETGELFCKPHAAILGQPPALCAAAPALYEALRNLLINLTTDAARRTICGMYGETHWRESVEMARAALRLAEGGAE